MKSPELLTTNNLGFINCGVADGFLISLFLP